MGGSDSSDLRVGIIGSTRLTRGLLHFLAPRSKIAVVVGLPDESLNDKADAVKLDDWCERCRVPLLKPSNLRDVVADIRDRSPDLILEFGDSRMIPAEMIRIPRLGLIGNHGAVLPEVKGGASLVWGRMFDRGWWGISLFFVDERIDAGPILAARRFSYPRGCTMREFVDLANRTTLSALEKVFPGVCAGSAPTSDNPPADIHVARHTDAFEAKQVYLEARRRGENVYLPARTPRDSRVMAHWPREFVAAFKAAHDDPYPRSF